MVSRQESFRSNSPTAIAKGRKTASVSRGGTFNLKLKNDVKADSSSDDGESLVSPTTTKNKRKTTKNTTYMSDSEDDSDEKQDVVESFRNKKKSGFAK